MTRTARPWGKGPGNIVTKSGISLLIALGVGGFVGACSKKDGGGGGGGASQSGCLQGVVVDGLTGERVAVASSEGKGVHVLAQDRLLGGVALVSDPKDTANANLKGEYYLCGVPLDEDYPIFVWMDGYHPFESKIRVRSTTASQSGGAISDIKKPQPVEIANIRLYPLNTQTQDLQVMVTHNGAPLADATVILRSVGTNFLDPGAGHPQFGLFLSPSNVRSPTLSGKSGADGTIVFKAADLVLGGHYVYTVLPPNGGQSQTAVAAANFVLGLRSSAGGNTNPYLITVDLNHSIDTLAELSRSTDNNDPDAKGKLTIWFNREIELVPSSSDQITGTLSGAVTAKLATNVGGNEASETVNVTVDTNMLVLEPVWDTDPDADSSKEPDLRISYSGIEIRPKDSPDTLTTVTITGSVKFYR